MLQPLWAGHDGAPILQRTKPATPITGATLYRILYQVPLAQSPSNPKGSRQPTGIPDDRWLSIAQVEHVSFSGHQMGHCSSDSPCSNLYTCTCSSIGQVCRWLIVKIQPLIPITSYRRKWRPILRGEPHLNVGRQDDSFVHNEIQNIMVNLHYSISRLSPALCFTPWLPSLIALPQSPMASPCSSHSLSGEYATFKCSRPANTKSMCDAQSVNIAPVTIYCREKKYYVCYLLNGRVLHLYIWKENLK